MLEQLNASLTIYEKSWKALQDARTDKTFFGSLKPVAVGWKVEDRADYDTCCSELHELADQIIETWMNGRWIAKFHLRDTKLTNGAEIVKIMQRRPGSTDAMGLDHVDFYSPAVVNGEAILSQEPELKWTKESNDIIDGYDWLSIWFDGGEAKLKSDTVLDIIQAELAALNAKITA